MSKPSSIERLNDAIDRILAGPGLVPGPETPEVESLFAVVEAFAGMPDPALRHRLGLLLRREAVMIKTAMDPIPPGFHTVTPYIVAADAVRMIDFVKAAFGAEEFQRAIGSAGGIHSALRIGESVLMIGGGGGGTSWTGASKPSAIHLFVDDADTVFKRAVQSGAEPVTEPQDLPYGERAGCVRDSSGSEWYIAAPQAGWHGAGVEGLGTFALYLHPAGTAQFIDFLRRAFDAVEVQRYDSPDGIVQHAKVRIGDTVIEMGEPHDRWQQLPGMIHMYVPDVDTVYAAALSAGASSLMEPANQPYGDRMAGIKDPFGYEWYIATHIGSEGGDRS
jgi:uncharacterized glyoxalase superfamily protein PhnB